MVMSVALLTCVMVIMAAPVESYASQTQAIRLVRSEEWRDVAEGAPTQKTEDIEFGGKKHKDMIHQDAGAYKHRPESMKSQVCDEAACKECLDKKECWHGKGGHGDDGILRVNIPAGSNGKRFVAELWARCGDGGGKWMITKTGQIKNGKILVYLNGVLQEHWRNKKLKLSLSPDSHIRIEFSPKDPGQKARASVFVTATEVDEEMDDCMAVKECLSLLGDGSAAAFRLRNSNKEQWHCLTASSIAQQDAVSKECAPWEQCLSQETGRKDKLVALLGAAFRNEGVNAALIISGLSMKQDPNTCVDPSVDDPESWECACLEHMITECEGANEECFNQLMCKNDSICCSWKQAHCEASDHCQDSLVGQSNASATKESALLVRREVRADGSVGTRLDLDGSMTGKCTSETQ